MGDFNDIRDTLGRGIRDLRISVTDVCNLRCTYCMPLEEYGEQYEFLPEEELLSYDEIVRLAALFVGFGATKLRLTGGEPLLRRELNTLVARLTQLEGVEEVALTTNGVTLRRHAEALREAGLTRLTVSLDSLDPDVFGRMNGRELGVQPVLAGIEAAQESGFSRIKINVVVQKGVNDQTLVDMVGYFKERDCIVRFIEYMDVGNRNRWSLDHVVPSREILARINERYPVRALGKNYSGEVASRYAFEDGSGEIGFISSVTEPFCASCTRVRLSADGRMFTCLFASAGQDLRDAIRAGETDAQLAQRIASIWKSRSDRYSEQRIPSTEAGASGRKIEMYQIGG